MSITEFTTYMLAEKKSDFLFVTFLLPHMSWLDSEKKMNCVQVLSLASFFLQYLVLS